MILPGFPMPVLGLGVKAPIEFIDATQAVATSNTSSAILVPSPSGVQSGDFLVLCVFVLNEALTASTPSGWTYVYDNGSATSNGRWYIFTKIASGSEPSFYSVGQTSGSTAKRAFILAYRYASEIGNAAYSSSSTTVSTDNHDSPTISLAGEGVLVGAWSYQANTALVTTPPSGMTLREEGNDVRLPGANIYDEGPTVAGTSAVKNIAINNNTTMTSLVFEVLP